MSAPEDVKVDVPPALDEKPKAKIPLFRSAGELTAHPPSSNWLIKDIFEAGSFVVLFGPSGSAKTFVVKDMLGCIATGIDYHGHRTRRGISAYLCGEGGGAIGRRMRAWELHNGHTLGDQAFVATEMPPLLDGGDDAIIEAVRSLPAPPAAICIDTLSRAMGGGDENSSQDMASVVMACDHIRAEFPGAALILVHHSGWSASDRARGSSVLRAAVDLEMKVSRDEDGVVTLSCTKAKDIEPPADHRFELERVELPWADEDGRPMSSVVPVLIESASPDTRGLGKNQRIALDVLRSLYEQQRNNLILAGASPDGARITIIDWREGCREEFGKTKFRDRFAEARQGLTRKHLISIDEPHVLLPEYQAPETPETYPKPETGRGPHPPETPERPLGLGHSGRDFGRSTGNRNAEVEI